ncbi:MAG TPA: PqqD family protein [Jatrophihabitans sp.]|nr:PqqD family protein [Jatrophihabitans sp.]
MVIRAQHAPGVLVEDLDQDVCLYRADIDEVLVLNATAGDVWRLTDGDYELDQVVQRLAEVYRLAADDIREQVRSVVADLLDRGYLVPADQAG